MTQLLQRAIAELHKLPESEQDTIAAIILSEIKDEERWATSFEKSQDQLAKLSDKVREDIRAGRVKDIGMDAL